MSRMRRVSVLGLSTILALSVVFTGCGKTTETATASQSASVSTATAGEATKAVLDPYVIDWYFVGPGQQADQALIEAELNKNLTDINATVSIHEFDWGTYEQKMQTLLATGEKIDLFFSASWGSNIFQNVRKGYVTDITDMLDQYAPDAKQVLSGGFIEGSKIDGRNYSLPCNKEKAASYGVLFNKKLVDKYNFDISTVNTLADLEPMFKVIKESEPGIYACEAAQKDGPTLLNNPDLGSTGIRGIAFDQSGGTDKYIPSYESKMAIDNWTTINKYYEAGYIRKDAGTLADCSADEKAGKVFAAFKQLKPGKDSELSSATGIEWVQKDLTKVYSSTGDIFGSMMAIGKSSKDPARALMFYNKFYKDAKLLNIMNFGIDGTHYVTVSDNIIDFAPATEGGTKSGWNNGLAWMFGNQFITKLFSNEDPKKWEKFQAFNDSAVQMANIGFIFNDENVKNEIAATANVQIEFEECTLNTGIVDTNSIIQKYSEKMKAAGIQKILDEINKQYSDWKTANNK